MGMAGRDRALRSTWRRQVLRRAGYDKGARRATNRYRVQGGDKALRGARVRQGRSKGDRPLQSTWRRQAPRGARVRTGRSRGDLLLQSAWRRQALRGARVRQGLSGGDWPLQSAWRRQALLRAECNKCTQGAAGRIARNAWYLRTTTMFEDALTIKVLFDWEYKV